MKLQLNQDKTKIVLKESTREEYNQLKRCLTPFVKGYRFTPRFKLTSWDGRFDYFNNGVMDFGLWSEIYSCCKEYGYPFEIINKEEFPRDNEINIEHLHTFCQDFYKDHKLKGEPFMPYDHQIEAAYKMLKHRFGLIEVATSGGKSLIFATMVFYYLKNINPNAKILLIVPSIMLVSQFYDDILDYNLGFEQENQSPLDIRITEIMSDKPRKVRDDKEPNIYIGTYQSLIKYGTPELQPYFFKQFDIVCCDESHKAGAKELTSIMRRSFGTAKYRVGMSGTFPTKGSCELMAIESVTGPVVMTVKARELIDKGLISDVKIKALILQHEDREFAESVYQVKKHGNGKRALELEREYAQKSLKRKVFIAKLVSKFKQNSLVLFYNIDYGTELYDYFRSNIIGKDFYYIDGQTSKEKREYIKQQMDKTDGNPKVLVASFGTLSTGVSIRALTNCVFVDSFKSNSLIRQSIGRVLRLHKEKNKAIIFDLCDQFHSNYKTILYNHYISRRDTIYKVQNFDFDELKIVI